MTVALASRALANTAPGHSLLRHRVNVLEFWREVPEEVYEQMDWAEAHDEEARAIAAEGQRTAATFLTGNGRTCYWYRLLHGLHATLSYTPELAQWPAAQLLRAVVEEQLPAAKGGRQLYDEPWLP
ncbi:hypothetical protein TSOC_012356 [Tetrabaena socialis]|uniref:Glycosyl transferase CAP10 domain-containing protein n=1 Tax=Tetrabaena socialis TaxID=47790 RepID=A0A2J7ZN78_9CHLO|nr:hypothetical protein TSOC_012356 [Tetrabaena socialis]|eukprot:PNH01734.1 hypothetical protein TSOC_012356 [Tetrabaena socialis]